MAFVRKVKKLFNDPEAFFRDRRIKKEGKKARGKQNLFKIHCSAINRFSIVSAVYNVEKYLPDFLNSIINQSIDFKKYIEIILVDDGSSDQSATIIKNYQEKYPKNITYIYKENGGQASARNLGLKSAKNDWVTFIDPDDFINNDYFKEINLAIIKNKYAAMVACNLVFFYEKDNICKDTHPLNFKFKNQKTLKIKNLDRFIQLSASSAVFHTNSIKNFAFDEELKPNFEDAKFLNQYLLNNLEKDAVFLPNAKYFYRKRADESSTLDGKLQDKRYYLDVTKKGYLELLEYAKKEYQEVPDFIQKTVIYDIFWLLQSCLNKQFYKNILSNAEIVQLKEILFEIFKYIDVKNIMQSNYASMWFFHKIAMANYFKNEALDFNIAYIKDIDFAKKNVLITYYSKEKTDIANIVFDNNNFKPIAHKAVSHDFFGDTIIYEHFARYNLINMPNFSLVLNGENLMIGYGNYKYDLNEFNKFCNQDIWIFMDTDLRADDNAEHLCRYIMKNNLKKDIYFALSKKSNDYARLENEGFKMLDFNSAKFKEYAKDAKMFISSGADGYAMKHFKIDANDAKFVFLQHGIIKDDLSTWLNTKNIHMFITSTKAEYDSIIEGNYRFSQNEVKLTGLARHDELIRKNDLIKDENTIILMPTWRHYLVTSSSETALREENDSFFDSNYFKTYESLLKSKKLKEILSINKYKLKVFLHPAMSIYKDAFTKFANELIDIKNLSEISLQDELSRAKALITDYSSIAFEMALLDKAIVYYQFDKDDFFESHTYKQGYFSYEKDGFGDIIENEKDLINSIDKLLKNDCKIENKYQKRIDETFTLRDGKNCERIYKEIVEL